MPPLQLNDDEMNLLLVLAAPIDQRFGTSSSPPLRPSSRPADKPVRSGSVLFIASGALFSGVISTRRSCRTQAKWRAPKRAKFKAGTLRARPGFIARRASWLHVPATLG
jgi:hypothetical protein